MNSLLFVFSLFMSNGAEAPADLPTTIEDQILTTVCSGGTCTTIEDGSSCFMWENPSTHVWIDIGC